MNFIKSSLLYNYLYSPKSWLHKQRSFFKIFFVLIYLSILPYLPIKAVYYSLIICLLIYNSIYIPLELNNYLCQIICFFSFLILISIQDKAKISIELIKKRRYYQLNSLFNYFHKNKHNIKINKSYLNQDYSLPISLVRLLTINFSYLIFTKLLLMTTQYKDIIRFFLSNCQNYILQRLAFEVQVAIQFINIILRQIKIMRIAYTTRTIKKKIKFSQIQISLCFFCIQQSVDNMYQIVYNMSSTMYSSEVDERNLNLLY